jgi:ATP-dependent DNA helicase RecQ
MADAEERRKAEEKLNHVVSYGNWAGCRRHFLLRYFNENYTVKNCGNCDGCVPRAKTEYVFEDEPVIRKIRRDTEDNGTYDRILFEELRKLRTIEAQRLNVPPYIIFGDKTLREMAIHYPQTETEFMEISGVGQQKLEQFGEHFLDAISEYVQVHDIKPQPLATIIKKTKYNGEGSTFDETKKFLKQKIAISAISEIRGLTQGTIVTHIERIAEEDPLFDISYLKPNDTERFKIIAEALQKTDGIALSPVKEMLGEEYSYDEIKLARIFLK